MESYGRKLFIFSNNNAFGQFVRCALVGGIASLVDLAVYSLAVMHLGIHHLLSNILSFTAGLFVNYFLSREWVFGKRVHDTKRDFFLFSVIGAIGLLMSSILLYVLVDQERIYYFLPPIEDDLAKGAAKIVTIGLVFIWNFFARRKIVFSVE